ncbi:MAG: glycosyltransferase family 4 protein, partial [Lutibacter sp.]
VKALGKPSEILFLSNLIESKGVLVHLEACEILKNKGIDFHCTYVGGEGEITSRFIEELINVKGLTENVHYVGKKTGDEKNKYFFNSDIFSFPTYNETFGLVLLEAMQFSLPVVSTFEGAIPEIVENGKTGFLVKQKDAVALAEKIELLINNEALRQEMGQAGCEKFKKEYTLTSFETNFTAILKSLN